MFNKNQALFYLLKVSHFSASSNVSALKQFSEARAINQNMYLFHSFESFICDRYQVTTPQKLFPYASDCHFNEYSHLRAPLTTGLF